RGSGLEEQGIELTLDKVALAGMEGIEVDLEEDLDGTQVGQIPGRDQVQEGVLIHDRLPDCPQRGGVTPLRGGRDAQCQGAIGLERATVLEDAPIGGALAWWASSTTRVAKSWASWPRRWGRLRVC